jgi:hypothetical protein
MMKTGKVSLIAAATFIAALSLPRSVSAGEISGSWTGSAFVQTFQVVDGVPVPVSSFSGPAFLDILGSIGGADEGDGLMTVGGHGIMVQVFGLLAPDVFGPTSANGSLLPVSGGPNGTSFGNFALSYEAILPDGPDSFIIVGDGTAVADLTEISFGINGEGFNGETITFASFSNIPEPSSIVMATSAALPILACPILRARIGKVYALARDRARQYQS